MTESLAKHKLCKGTKEDAFLSSDSFETQILSAHILILIQSFHSNVFAMYASKDQYNALRRDSISTYRQDEIHETQKAQPRSGCSHYSRWSLYCCLLIIIFLLTIVLFQSFWLYNLQWQLHPVDPYSSSKWDWCVALIGLGSRGARRGCGSQVVVLGRWCGSSSRHE